MNNISDIKKQLHLYIDMIEDDEQLLMLNDIAQEYAVKQTDILDLLTPAQIEQLKKSQEEIRNGGGIHHKEVMKMAKQWLKKSTK